MLLSKKLKMGMFNRHFCLALLCGFALTICVPVQGQSGFISLDCGLPENSSYTDPKTTLYYMSDATFVDTGIIKNISSEYKTNDVPEQLWNVRSFPEGTRNCYYFRLIVGVRYLIRGTFMYGNYDGEGKLPEFELHLGANMWDIVQLDTPSKINYREIIHVASLDYIHVCLVNKDLGTPFISALEFRPLRNDSYVTKSGSLILHGRYDDGSVTNQTFRYKDDIYDRIWLPWTYGSPIITLNTSHTIRSQNEYQPPSAAMTTAATPSNASDPFTFRWYPFTINATAQYYIYMHFAELEELQANQYRAFNIFLNEEYFDLDPHPVVPYYLSTTTVYNKLPLSGSKYEFSLNKSENSTLPPIINASEMYMVKEFLQSETDQADVDAITKIKSMYGITRNWQGDPCAPKEFVWDGLKCTYDSFDPPRIVSLDLSSSGLTGEIAASISNLTMIQTLDMSNNNLTGRLPNFLSQLPSLRVLNLARNQLTGSVPTELIEKSKGGSLSLSLEVNPKLCQKDSCNKQHNKFHILIVATIVLVSIIILGALAIFWRIKKKRHKGLATSNAVSNNQYESLDSKKRKFTYSDIVRITNNFERVLGKGGFGAVYHGYIDDTQVAVKVLSPSSTQGCQQFHAEVEVLMRVHHRHLTSLVGYCNEGTRMGLVYEYMANGDLSTHLSAAIDDSKANILSWERRIRIALDAAQGLEYLHNGCKPPIVHRDVKCANILLNEDFCAKLADFGLSKSFPTDSGTHMSTVVAGTHGYLDPEYCTKNRLTEKSDVYSFGVVLLKIITCQPVIGKDEEHTHIVEWVNFMLANGDIQMIIDPKLQGDLEINSVWKAVEVAKACVSQTSIKRPTMSQVVVELKECLAIELARKQGREAELRDPVELFSVNSISELNPSPR